MLGVTIALLLALCGIASSCNVERKTSARRIAPPPVRPRQDDCEFFASKTRREVGRSHDHRAENGADRLQAFVSLEVTVGVVVGFEMIDIHEQHAQGRPAAARAQTFS
jgi:hypothetical protein